MIFQHIQLTVIREESTRTHLYVYRTRRCNRKTLVRTRAFSGENSPPMKFTFLGTSHFLSPGDGGVGWWWKYFRGSPGFQGYCRGISHRQLSIKGCYIENDW